MTRDSLRSLEHHDAFLERHIGPNDAEIAHMLRVVGHDSLDALTDAIVPASIKSPAPLALPGKPGDPIPQSPQGDKPRFDFYKILPGNSEAIPDPKPAEGKSGEPKQADGTKGKDGTEAALKEPVYLQTGSFQNASDADNQKAKLAFMGIEAVVQQVMIQDKTFYRVRTGPYYRLEELNKVRAELAKAGIDAQLAKNKEQ
mgnify:CR=1 FL=1